MVLFLQHHFLHQNFLHYNCLCHKYLYSFFNSKETTHAEINVQNFVTQKCWCKSSCRRKNAYKNKSSKIFDYLVRVHNDKGLELCGREGSSKWTFVSQPNERSHKRASTVVPYYKLLYIPKLSSWSSSFIPCRYLPACIIPTLYHYGRELNSQIFLTTYFCTRFFFATRTFASTFLHHKILHIYFGVCCFFAIKKTVQIFATQTIVMQKVLMQKMMLQK